MKKKNGFVFVETMVTIVILSTALLIIYSLFNNVIIKEKRKSYYDDPLYVYRANYLTLMFENIVNKASTTIDNPGEYLSFGDLLKISQNGQAVIDGVNNNLRIFTCENDIFSTEDGSKAECQQFFLDNQIYRIYISTYDLSYVDECARGTRNTCINYNSLYPQAKRYFKQLSYVPGVEGYYVIFEFYDNGKDGVCSSENCMHQFASVKFGGNNKVVNLNE
ncbi:MAG: prepilin-type N-terminal cleavage/methylation domain-containing protein [Bacilli bacterium]|nr:prepilin-type N-terminal cleavage/methylation domain-containing protein [Bacilli bacterium]